MSAMDQFSLLLLQSVVLIFISVTVAGYLTLKMAEFMWERIISEFEKRG